jgi:hypothetical protein
MRVITALFPQGEDMMRFPTTIIIVALGTISALAQENNVAPTSAPTPLPVNRCAKLAGKLTATTPSSPQLFRLTASGWEEVAYNSWGTDLTVDSYQGGRLSFIYVVPPSDVRTRQFLSIRTIADANAPDHWVNLRRQLSDFDTVFLEPTRVITQAEKRRAPSDAFIIGRMATALTFQIALDNLGRS